MIRGRAGTVLTLILAGCRESSRGPKPRSPFATVPWSPSARLQPRRPPETMPPSHADAETVSPRGTGRPDAPRSRGAGKTPSRGPRVAAGHPYEFDLFFTPFSFKIRHRSVTVRYSSSSARLISQSVIPARSVHVVTGGKTSPFYTPK